MPYKDRNTYLQQLYNQRNNYSNSTGSINPSDDSTNVGVELSSFASMNTPLETSVDTDNITETSSERNGYQRVLDTAEELQMNMVGGIFNAFDSIWDGIVSSIGKVGSIFGADTGWAEDLIEYDWSTKAKEAINILNPSDIFNGDVFTSDYWEDYGDIFTTEDGASKLTQQRSANSYISNTSDSFQSGYKAFTEGVGELLPSIGLAVATGGSSLAEQAALQGSVEAFKGLGSGTESALKEGADFQSASNYGLIRGAISGATTAASVGIGGSVLNNSGQGTVSKLSSKVGEKVSQVFTNSSTAEVLISKATEILARSVGEGAEQAADTLLDPLLKQITYDSQAIQKAYGNDEAIQNTLANAGSAFLIGGLTSAVVGGAREIASGINAGSFDRYKENYYVAKETSANYQKAKKYSEEYDRLVEDYYNKTGLRDGNLVSKEEFIEISNKLNEDITKLNSKYDIDNVLKSLGTKDYKGTNAEKYQSTIETVNESIASDLRPRRIENALPKGVALAYIQKSGWKPSGTQTESSKNPNGTQSTQTYTSSDNLLRLTTNEDGSTTITTPDTPNDPINLVSVGGENSNEVALHIENEVQANAIMNYIADHPKNDLPNKIVHNNEEMELTRQNLEKIYQEAQQKQELSKQNGEENGSKLKIEANETQKADLGTFTRTNAKSTDKGTFANKTDKVTFDGEAAKDYSYKSKKSRTELVKGYANAYSDKVINAKSTHELAQGIIGGISSVLPKGTTISYDTKSISNELFENFNLNRKGKDKDKYYGMVNDVAKSILNSSLEYDSGVEDKAGVSVKSKTTFLDVLKATDPVQGKSDEEYIQMFSDLIDEVLVDKSKDTKIKKVQDFYTNKIAKLENYFRQYRDTNIQATNTKIKVSKFLQKFDENKVRLIDGVTVSSNFANNGDVAVYANMVVKGLRQLKLVRSTNNFSPSSVKRMLEHIGGYNEELLKHTLIPYHERLENQIKGLMEVSETWEDKHRLDIYETQAVSEIANVLMKSVDEALSNKKEEQRKKRANGVTDVVTAFRYDKKEKTNFIQEEVRNNNSIRVTLANLFGESSEVYKIVYSDPTSASNDCILKEMEYKEELTKIAKKYNVKDKELSKKVTFKDAVITYGVLCDIYAKSLSDGGVEDLLGGGVMVTTAKGNEKKIMLTQEDIDSLPKLLGEKLTNFTEEILVPYNTTFREDKEKADLQNYGFANTIDGVYYPSQKAETKGVSIGQNTIQNMNSLDASNKSFNKRRTGNHTFPTIAMDIREKFYAYSKGLATYQYMYSSFRDLDLFLNARIKNPVDGSYTTTLSLIEQTYPQTKKYIIAYVNRITGFKNVRAIVTKWSQNFFSNLASSVLYGNLSVVFKQMGSAATIMNETRTSSLGKAIAYAVSHPHRYNKDLKYLKENVGVIAIRIDEHQAITSETLSTKLSKFAKFFGYPMEKMDEAVIVYLGWNAAKFEAEARGYGKFDTPENIEAAKGIITDIVNNTQSNNRPSELNVVATGEAGSIRKFLSYFTSDLRNKFNYIVELSVGKKNSNKRVEFFEKETGRLEKESQEIKEKLSDRSKILEECNGNATEAEKKTEEYKQKVEENERTSDYLKDRIKKEKEYTSNFNKRRAKLVLSLFISGVMVAGIDELMKRIYGRKGWNENTMDDFAKNVMIESTIANIPYVSQILNAIEYDSDISNFEATQINQIIDIVSSAMEFQDGFDMNKLKSMLISIAKLGGSISGIPITNLYNLGMGIYKNVNSAGYKAEALIKGYSASYSTNLFSEACANGNTKMANGYLDYLLGVYKGGSLSNEAESEITRLTSGGYSVLPYSVMTSYENDNGETVSLTSVQSSNFTKYYFEASKQMEKMIKTDEYKNLNDEYKAKAIKKLYSAYYSYAKIKAVNLSDTSKLGNLIVNTSNGVSIGKFSAILTQCNALNTKAEVMAYLNKTSLTYNEKLVICQLLGYSLTSQNEARVTNYLKSVA